MNLIFEENKLKNYLGEALVEMLKKYNMIVAGGAVTSIFTNRDINDIDIYARSEEDLIGFLEDFWDYKSVVISSTRKATQFKYGELVVQLIHFNYFDEPSKIFDSFDFTVCMAAYDFKDNKFYFHDDFMKHNSQKIIRFNSNTAYPIVSALRVKKYEEKGYKISKAEFVRIVMTCMTLNITTYEELMEHLGGMYGVDLSKVFKELEGEEFDLHKAIEILADITYTDEYFKVNEIENIFELDEILCKISPTAVKYLEFKNETYRVYGNGELEYASKVFEPHTKVGIEDVFKDNKLYKFVYKNDSGEYVSYHDSSFKYVIGEIAEAKGELKTDSHYCDSGKLHFNVKEKIKKSTYYNRDNKVLLEVIVNTDDLIDIDGNDKVTARKVYVLREVPESEWKMWIEESKKENKRERGMILF